jgi:probable F420-dependent oxidoreductase
MQLGFALPTSGAWATPVHIATIAKEAEQHGFRAVWTFQRWLADERLPGVYQSVLDPMVALGYAAAVTERVRLGTAIVNAPFYAPAALAKQFATLDILSGGRLDAGLGLGWSEAEFAAAGVPLARRGRRFDEWLDCLDVLLTGEEVEFRGEFYTVPASTIAPRCVQRPRPPILIGGSAPAALQRAGTRGDGWISSRRASLADIRAAVSTVGAAAQAAGKRARFVVRGVTVVHDSPVSDADRALLTGTPEQIAEGLASYAAAGVDEVFLDLNFDSARVGNPDADPALGMELARAVLPLGARTW